jgi:hypothetical protein
MLTFEVASFDIGYSCILGMPFLLKFMAIIHTTYATMKMSGPKGMITIKADQRDALACENMTLTHVGRFGEKEAQEQVAKVAKTHGGSTSFKSPVPKTLPSTPFDLCQPRRAHMVPQRPTSSPSISRQTVRRRRPMIRMFQSAPATRTRSSGSAHALMPNRNSRSSLFYEKIWMSSHGRYQICSGSLGR